MKKVYWALFVLASLGPFAAAMALWASHLGTDFTFLALRFGLY